MCREVPIPPNRITPRSPPNPLHVGYLHGLGYPDNTSGLVIVVLPVPPLFPHPQLQFAPAALSLPRSLFPRSLSRSMWCASVLQAIERMKDMCIPSRQVTVVVRTGSSCARHHCDCPIFISNTNRLGCFVCSRPGNLEKKITTQATADHTIPSRTL